MAALSTEATGCFGSFPLTRTFYAHSKRVSSDTLMQELLCFTTAFIVLAVT